MSKEYQKSEFLSKNLGLLLFDEDYISKLDQCQKSKDGWKTKDGIWSGTLKITKDETQAIAE